MDRQRFKGLYTGKGYTLASLAKKMGITEQTLITRTKSDTLTIRDIKMLIEIFEITPEEAWEIFYSNKTTKKQ